MSVTKRNVIILKRPTLVSKDGSSSLVPMIKDLVNCSSPG